MLIADSNYLAGIQEKRRETNLGNSLALAIIVGRRGCCLGKVYSQTRLTSVRTQTPVGPTAR